MAGRECDDGETLVMGGGMGPDGIDAPVVSSGSGVPDAIADALPVASNTEGGVNMDDPLLALLEDRPAAAPAPMIGTTFAAGSEQVIDRASCADKARKLPPLPPPTDAPAEVKAGTDAGCSLGGIKRGATQTLDMAENLMLPTSALPETGVSEHDGMLLSTNPCTAPDILLNQDAVAVGRDSACSTQLADPRISGEQFLIRRMASAKGTWIYELEDRSRNGTLVNKRLLRSERHELHDQDLVEVLPSSKVGQAAAVAFLFHAPMCAVKSGGDEPPAKIRKLAHGSDTVSELFEGAMCVICQEVLHRATSAQPCMHSFCSSCLGTWLRMKTKCPVCRMSITAVAKNHALIGLIDGLVKAHPERQRSATALAELDSRDSLHAAGYCIAKLTGAASAPPAFEPAPVPIMDGMDGSDSDRDSDDDDESEEPTHAWTYPGAMRPSCFHCAQPAWQNLRSATERIATQDHTATALLKAALASNSFEQGILQEWLHTKSQSLAQAIVSLLADPNPAEAPQVRVRPQRARLRGASDDDPALPVGAWSDVPACHACAQDVLQAVVYSIRERIPAEELPHRARNRRNCWYGKSCRTQSHKQAHAERLNHICEQTRG
eukprot:TRINITY_DN31906_c0_g1_i1.p1 TRINITY_DN31906_c0_g1~~TRINITY_DN31906_c0_g1_i1.p1  ORF type:complete len:606 (+),score=91.97 TRINITY_DN31906_c0_g1_i1:133-1950(+)